MHLNPYRGIRFNGNQFILGIPEEVLIFDILQSYLRLKDLSIHALGGTCKYLFKYWRTVFEKNEMAICVPEDVLNLDLAMAVARIFSLRKVYTRNNTIKIVLGEGEYEVDGDYHKQLIVTCNNVTFTGRGSSKTTVRGGLHMTNRMNVFVKYMNVTNPHHRGCSFRMEGVETNIEVVECTVTNGRIGMFVRGGATVTATQCAFMENEQAGVCAANPHTKVRLNDCTMHHNTDGVIANDHAAVLLHGKNTDIHSNRDCGIGASNHGKILIHLPKQHKTSHDNEKQNRSQLFKGTITNVK